MARALQMANRKITQMQGEVRLLEEKLAEQEPAVIFTACVTESDDSILIGELAKILRQSGVEVGQNRLFEWLRRDGFLIKRQGNDYNLPTQRAMEMGLLWIKESTVENPKGVIRLVKTPRVTGKGQVYFINRYNRYKKETKPAAQ